MMTLREALLTLAAEPVGSVFVEDNGGGGQLLPQAVLLELDNDNEGKALLARTVIRVPRPWGELDSMIAFVNEDGYEYPNEPHWYIVRPMVWS